MEPQEIGQWCLDNRKLITKIILRYDRYPDHLEDNFNTMVCRLMQKGIAFKDNKGAKFITYAYKILTREMIEYINWRTSKLSYSHVALTSPKYSELRINKEKNFNSFGIIPDFVEAKAGAKDLSYFEESLDKKKLFKEINNIIENYLPPVQKRLMKYRYNEHLECINTLTSYAKIYNVSAAAALNNERKAILNIQKRLGGWNNNR